MKNSHWKLYSSGALAMLLLSAFILVGIGGCNQQVDKESPVSSTISNHDPRIIAQRFASEAEDKLLESLPETQLFSRLQRDNSEPTTVLEFDMETAGRFTCYITPITLERENITFRLAINGSEGWRAIEIALEDNPQKEGKGFYPGVMTFSTLDGQEIGRYIFLGIGEAWQRARASQLLKASGSWWDCFLRCVDYQVSRSWWLNAICGPGTPIQTYVCILAEGAWSWGIISWCLGYASGYCP